MTPDRKVVPFRAWHYEWLGPAGEHGVIPLPVESLLMLEKELSYTLVVDGLPIACAGVIRQWPGRYVAWAYLVRGSLRHLPWISQTCRANLATVKGRIEFTVRKDFLPGQRWARELGFEVETPLLRAYGPRGEDHIGYVRIQ